MWEQSPIPLPVDTSITGVLSRTFKIYGNHFLAFILLLVLVQTPITIIDTVLTNWQDQQQAASGLQMPTLTPGSDMTPEEAQQVVAVLGQQLGGMGIFFLVAIVAAYVVLVFVTAPLTYIASESYQGRSASLKEAFEVVGKKLKVLLGGYTLVGIIVLGLNIALGFILYACGLGVGLAIYVGCAIGLFIVPIVIVEDRTITDSLKRSWRLGKRRIWALVGIWLATLVVLYVLSLLIGAIGGLIASVLTGPILPIACTLLYHDTRAKYEPEGVEIAADARLLANDDILNLAIMCVGALVLLLVLGGLWLAAGGPALVGGL